MCLRNKVALTYLKVKKAVPTRVVVSVLPGQVHDDLVSPAGPAVPGGPEGDAAMLLLVFGRRHPHRAHAA